MCVLGVEMQQMMLMHGMWLPPRPGGPGSLCIDVEGLIVYEYACCCW